MRRIAFTTLGCKTNHYDTDAMAQACRVAGFEVVSSEDQADVYVINTCTVTSAADAQARNLVRRIVRRNPKAAVVVCGCASQVDPQRFKAIEGVSYVLGVRSADELVNILNNLKSPPTPLYKRGEKGDLNDPHFPLTLSPLPIGERGQDRARAFLKIQDGCNHNCAYCIVPQARGPSKSVEPASVLREAQQIIAAGWREIVLTGVHIGQYGRDLRQKISLNDLVRQILENTADCRIRLSSLDPDEIDEQTMDLFEHPGICRHLHLSLQSGCDSVLKTMNRAGKVERYADLIKSLDERMQDISIGADIIVGFPGETDDQFTQTEKFLESLPFAYLHIFPYSRRPQTEAFSMPLQMAPKIKKQRAQILKRISAAKRMAFYKNQCGKRHDVVIVSSRPNENGCFKGISDNYVPVLISGKELRYREKYPVQIIKVKEGNVYGSYTRGEKEVQGIRAQAGLPL